jgi:hypothetical protein
MPVSIPGTPVGTGNLGAATSHSITLPTGIVEGEVICVYVMLSQSNKGASITGYTSLDVIFPSPGGSAHIMLTKVATVSEPASVTLNITPSGTAGLNGVAFRATGVDTADIFNSDNFTSLTTANTSTPSIPASTLTTVSTNGVITAISAEASRDVVSFDADLDLEIYSDAASNSFHAFIDYESGGVGNPQYDFTMSSAREYNISIFELKASAAATPTINTVTDPATDASTSTIAGTDFEAAQGTGNVDLDQGAVTVSPSVNSWADTSIEIVVPTIKSTQLKYGTTDYTVNTDASGSSNTLAGVINPATGEAYVDLVSINATATHRITAIADLAIGDQIWYTQELLLNGVTPSGKNVTVNDDASFTFPGDTPVGTYEFTVQVWDTADQTWGSSAQQTVVVGTPTTPVILTVTDPAAEGGNSTLTGTDFESPQGAGAVALEQGAVSVSPTVNTWADTSIEIAIPTIKATQLKYGSANYEVTNNSAGVSNSLAGVITPASGELFTDLTSINVSAPFRITVLPGIAASDQIWYTRELLLNGVTPSGKFVTVNADSSFSFPADTPAGNYEFTVQAWDDGTQTWGSSAQQTLVAPEPTVSGLTGPLTSELTSSLTGPLAI